eukprot:3698182-Rhodomonas_salina.3
MSGADTAYGAAYCSTCPVLTSRMRRLPGARARARVVPVTAGPLWAGAGVLAAYAAPTQSPVLT